MNCVQVYQTPETFDKRNDLNAYGELSQVEYYSTTVGAWRKCYIHTPADFNKETTYPVLYLLHGIGGMHSEWLDGAPNEILSNLVALGQTRPMITVIPNVRAAKDDRVPSNPLSQANIDAFDNFINDLRNDLMPYIKANYAVADKREECAIAGLSMGGREALYIGITMADIFGSIGAFSPAPGLLPHSDLNYPGQLTASQMNLPDQYKDSTFILICNGNQDNVIHNIPFQYHRALEENEVPHLYYTIDGGHDFDVWKNGLYHFASNIFRDTKK